MRRLKASLVLILVLVLFLAPASFSSQDKININSADAEELTSLTGIGPTLAERIVEHSDRFSFESKEDIMQVSGIGEATYQDIKDSITVE